VTYRGCFINFNLEENIKDNYNIYILIIAIVVSVKCEIFKMSKISHLNMLLPSMKIEKLMEVNEDDGSGPMGTIENMTRTRERWKQKMKMIGIKGFFWCKRLPKCRKIKIKNISHKNNSRKKPNFEKKK